MPADLFFEGKHIPLDTIAYTETRTSTFKWPWYLWLIRKICFLKTDPTTKYYLVVGLKDETEVKQDITKTVNNTRFTVLICLRNHHANLRHNIQLCFEEES